jgi:hypothetical protein
VILRPGTCNAFEVVPPKLEWSTMGGGTQNSTVTKSVSLLKIHSLAVSNSEETREDDDDDDDEDLLCFFTLTTSEGDVHIFEAITADESHRIVIGIKNVAARFSNQLIAGDTRAFTDFYDNYGGAKDVRFTPEEAMGRLSHSFFE